MMNLEGYLLTCLQEECNEVGQRISKIQRFGINECQPGQPYDNRERCRQEIIDLISTIDCLVKTGSIAPIHKDELKPKKQRIKDYMKLSVDHGLLDPEAIEQMPR